MGNNLREARPELQAKPIPMLDLVDVYREHGPEVGWAELQRRSICPPTPTSEMDLDTAIRNEVGHLSLTIDYVELTH